MATVLKVPLAEPRRLPPWPSHEVRAPAVARDIRAEFWNMTVVVASALLLVKNNQRKGNEQIS